MSPASSCTRTWWDWQPKPGGSGSIAGHLVGEFPHEKIKGAEIESYIAPGSDRPMRRHDRNGQVCHWILEVHLTDSGRQFGGFFEELLDLRA
jgi:Xaa-Pro dipeptidase